MENNLKEVPYTIELDWNSGNIFLNIPSLGSKLVINQKTFDSIKSTMDMSMHRDVFRIIKPGDEFYVANDSVRYKILDVTSDSFNKFNKDIEISKDETEYVSKEGKKTVNVCINHSKTDETHVFICDAVTKQVIFGAFVVAAVIIDNVVEKIIAKPLSEMNTISKDGSFLYKRV